MKTIVFIIFTLFITEVKSVIYCHKKENDVDYIQTTTKNCPNGYSAISDDINENYKTFINEDENAMNIEFNGTDFNGIFGLGEDNSGNLLTVPLKYASLNFTYLQDTKNSPYIIFYAFGKDSPMSIVNDNKISIGSYTFFLVMA